MFNPDAKFCTRTITEAYKLHEAQKRLKYDQRIVEVENSFFNPLVFATIGGAAPTASKIMSRLAFQLSEKSEDTYAEVMGYISTKVIFALLKSSVLCLRGCRSLKRQPETVDSAIGAINQFRNEMEKRQKRKQDVKNQLSVVVGCRDWSSRLSQSPASERSI